MRAYHSSVACNAKRPYHTVTWCGPVRAGLLVKCQRLQI